MSCNCHAWHTCTHVQKRYSRYYLIYSVYIFEHCYVTNVVKRIGILKVNAKLVGGGDHW